VLFAPRRHVPRVNTAFGWRFVSDRSRSKLVAQNLFDERVQQHIFGDLIDRKVAAQVSIEF
jgi:hypothetical protein